jgi:hypothetical protein
MEGLRGAPHAKTLSDVPEAIHWVSPRSLKRMLHVVFVVGKSMNSQTVAGRASFLAKEGSDRFKCQREKQLYGVRLRLRIRFDSFTQ